MKYKDHLDFGGVAQLLQIVLEKLAANPTGWEGRVYFNTATKKIRWHNGTNWIDIDDTSGLVTSIIAGGGITVNESTGAVTIGVDVDGTTLELSDGTATAKVRIKDAGVTTDKLATNAVTTIKVTDKNITFAKIQDVPTMIVVGRVASGTGVTSAITILTDLEAIISAHDSLVSAKAVKDYVDNLVGGLGTLQGGWSASANNVYPTGANKGDYWYITTAGAIAGVNYDVGDVIIANKDSAGISTPEDWISLEVNREQATTTVLGVVRFATQAEARAMTSINRALTPSNLEDVKATDAETQTGSETHRFITPANLSSRTATEGRTGIAAVATQAEVNTGTDNSKIVTPAKLKVYVNNQFAAFGTYVTNIGNGVLTAIPVSHGLNTRDVIVEIWDTTTYETVFATVTRTLPTEVTINFAEPPASGAFRVMIKK